MDSAQPIIVKKIKKGGHGHHGGAWKVAFADFVTAMMAFFMLMWLMGSTTPEERAAISDYFQNPSAVQGPGGASTSMIKLGAIDQDLNNKDKGETAKVEDSKSETKAVEVTEVEKEIEVQKDAQRLDQLKTELEKAIEQSTALNPFKDQILLDITAEGLRIQIVDKEGRPMFDSGSSALKDYTSAILTEMSKLINKVPNRISLTGHTDATPYNSMRGYSNWELSADRANSSRRALVFGGLDKEKIAKVVGLSSTVLFDKKNPRNPINRRISIIVLNKAAEDALKQEDGAQVSDPGEAAKAINGELLPESANDVDEGVTQQPLPLKSSKPITLRPKNLTRSTPTVLGEPPKTSLKASPRTLTKPGSKPQLVTDKPSAASTNAENGQVMDEDQSVNARVIRPIKPITPIQLPVPTR